MTGSAAPLGARVSAGGVNFSLFSKHATGIELLFFDRAEDARPAAVMPIDARTNRDYHYWHVFVPGVRAGQIYGYRAFGPFDPPSGHRFDPTKVLLDPYGRGVVVPAGYSRDAPSASGDAGDNASTAMKSVVVDPSAYDWEGDRPLNTPSSRTVIYEMHVRGFTRHPSSGVSERTRGTYAGLIEKIPYLQQLGVTAVELLPVFQFDPQAVPPGHGRVNYWGYQPVSFFAPHAAYSSRRDPAGPVDEFRDMVKALHRAGIEVILDVVFNHTAEGGVDGPTQCFRGLANRAYYILQNDASLYADFSGCGNTLNANHPVVRRLIVDSLRYWVNEMHVDGFRFDLASILSRDPEGRPMPQPPVLWDIESEPALARTKLIAEAWDAAGLYQVGTFIGDAWKEWNGRYRDDVRSFFRGEDGTVRRLADRLLGSAEVYGHKGREAEASVNFVTCHDGFSLNDLVSFNNKHNEANGEDNRDGADDNRSWNCGAEGPTGDPEIEALRNRQVKNFLTVTLLSLGMPMILMGDEVRRTQGGNNNAYCHDDESNWFDWTLAETHADVLRFVSLLNARRATRDLTADDGSVSLTDLLKHAKTAWHGVKHLQPDWSLSSHSLAFGCVLARAGLEMHLIMNAYWERLDFELPEVAGREDWRRWIDTSRESPADIVEWDDAPPVEEPSVYRTAPRSVVVLWRHLAMLLLLVLLVPGRAAWAQTGRGGAAPPAAQTPAQPAEQAQKDPLGRDTPRGTVLGFMSAARNAKDDISPLYLNTSLTGAAAVELAHKLYVVLDSRLPARPIELSDQPGGLPDNPLKPDEDVVGTVNTAAGTFDLVVERVTRPGSPPVWLFSAETLSYIPAAHDEVNLVKLDRFLPDVLKPRIAGIRLFEWLALFLLVPLQYQLLGALGRPFKRRVPGLARLLVLGIAIRWGSVSFELPLLERQFWWAISGLMMIAAACWLLLRLNEYGETRIRRRLSAQGDITSLLRLGRRFADAIVILAALLFVVTYFGFDPTAALAGLGIGGIAVALAAQKTLENVIAGLSLIFDKAVQVGDFLKFGDTVGSVDYIGLRSTRIRTLDRTILSVPNGQIASVGIETLSARDKFWFRHIVALRFGTTVAEIRTVIEGIHRLLLADTRVDAATARVRFIRLGASSLDVEVYAYIVAADWERFLEIQQELLLLVMDTVERSGTAIAMPAQTLHIAEAPHQGT